MNAAIFNRTPVFLAYGLPALILVVSLSIAFSPLLISYPELAIGITYDLTITAPLLYLFFIRKTKIPKITVLSFFTGGIIIASLILPIEQQFHLSLIKLWILPVAETIVLGYIGFTVYKTLKTYKSVKQTNTDVLQIFQKTCQKTFDIPFLANVLAFEIAVIYYAFFSWKKFEQTEKTFSYHKKSGKIALFGAIILIIAVETFVLHFLVAQWNEIVAWILTLSSVYVLLQIFAHLKAVLQRPVEISVDKLFVRYGLFGGAEIKLKNIEKIEFSSVKTEEKEKVKQVALLGELEQFNTKIYLKKETDFAGFYGIKTKFKTLLLFLDEKEKFQNLIAENDNN